MTHGVSQSYVVVVKSVCAFVPNIQKLCDRHEHLVIAKYLQMNADFLYKDFSVLELNDLP